MSSAFRLFGTDSVIDDDRPPKRKIIRNLEDVLEAAGIPSKPLMSSRLRDFQKAFGLKPDGIVTPGGPTEGMLNLTAVADRKGGTGLVETLKPAMRDLAKQGMSFTRDPRNPAALGMVRDAQGRRVDPERAGAMLRHTGAGAPDLSGTERILAERVVGKTGRDKIVHGVTAKKVTGDATEIDGGDGLDVLESASGSDDLGGADISNDKSSSGANSAASKADVENSGVSNRLTDLHRHRSQDKTHKELFGVKRDRNGKVIRSGLPDELFERTNEADLGSILDRTIVADQSDREAIRRLKDDINELRGATSNDRYLLNMYVDMMRGNLPSRGMFERVLSDNELNALATRRADQSRGLTKASLATAPVLPVSVAFGILSLEADRQSRQANAKFEMRRNQK